MEDLMKLTVIDMDVSLASIVLSKKGMNSDLVKVCQRIHADHPHETYCGRGYSIYSDAFNKYVNLYTGDVMELMRSISGVKADYDTQKMLLRIACIVCKSDMDLYEVCI